MDTTPAVDEQEQAATPPGKGKADEDDFQMVSPRKAAREIQQPEPTPIKTTKKYTKLAEENTQREAPKNNTEINLKIIPNYNLVLKEINQQYQKPKIDS
ncbi:hypothetical protein AVEN_33246-1 [Araneus ventricosus]|uniref:Uncharacterized protein n=1 Tax=Araneus ventricosus TaxID=182803 RepID=A0A4Y2I2W0_ARAVE|nr:hypothetical protein AVEN_33246-1 [Araneus ventricosus]